MEERKRSLYLPPLQGFAVANALLFSLFAFSFEAVGVHHSGGGLDLVDFAVLASGVCCQLLVEFAAQAGWPQMQLLYQLPLAL